MRSTFSILFYLKKNEVKKSGFAPLMARITINGESSQFSMKTEVRPEDWDTKNGRVHGRSKEAADLNSILDDARVKIRDHYRGLCSRESVVTAPMVRDTYLGTGIVKNTLLGLFDLQNDDYKTLVGKQTSEGTYRKYVRTRTILAAFLAVKYGKKDIALKDIAPKFITDFERYLLVDRNLHTNAVRKYMQRFKRVITFAHNNGLISVNPFSSFRIQQEDTDRGYLSETELTALMQYPVAGTDMEAVRDVFVFICFTGLSYIDAASLHRDDIKLYFDGNLWIVKNRQKTNVPSKIRLLPVALQILEKYRDKCPDGKVLSVPSNGSGNKLLKKFGELCGINKRVTFHLGRHTFATTVTLGKGVPMESVSKMLGHKSIKTTQIYARIVDEKVSRDMDVLSPKLGALESANACCG